MIGKIIRWIMMKVRVWRRMRDRRRENYLRNELEKIEKQRFEELYIVK